ncbi:FAD-binding protein [Vicingaceae bacterium]|nr:FAD-binding protein [Vicingaceae bacterium]
MRSPFFDQLKEIFSADRLLAEPAQLVPFESDGLTAFAERPKAVVIPETADEIVRTVQACHQYSVPFVARGSGTSLSGGSLPVKEGIVIALNRMNRILKLDPQQRFAIVEPGTINLEVSRAGEPHGLYYAPDPSSQKICTIGGNVAFNAGGVHCLKYGMTSNHVLGMKVVLPDGKIANIGSRSIESIGPDETGLFVGSEGLFGIALEITLRLLPISSAFHTVIAGYESIELAGDAVTGIVGSGLLPAALEIMDRLTMDAAQTTVDVNYPPEAQAVLIVELDGSAEQVEDEKEILNELISASKAMMINVAANAEERALIWKGRKSAFSAVGRLSHDFIVQDCVVPRSKLGFALRKIGELSERFDVRVANVFHAGDGNLHPLILFDASIEGQLERAEELGGEIVKMCTDLGGSITGEHGVGMEKRDFLTSMFDDEDIDMMKRIRLQIDSREIANPGKMFPSAEAPALSNYGLHPLEKSGTISRE